MDNKVISDAFEKEFPGRKIKSVAPYSEGKYIIMSPNNFNNAYFLYDTASGKIEGINTLENIASIIKAFS